MNEYIALMKDTVDYIEEHMGERLTLTGLAGRAFLSEYHFDRLFRVIVGVGLKQYVLGRKLTVAAERLIDSERSVLDIAIDLGFEYPEVFSRAFKKQFGISPTAFRLMKPAIETVAKAEVVNRTLVNVRGGIAVKADFCELPPLLLEGVAVDASIQEPGFEKVLQKVGGGYIEKTAEAAHVKTDCFYSLVQCRGDGSGWYTFYFGRELLEASKAENSASHCRLIPGGWYADFAYEGDMNDIRVTFTEDLFRWIAVQDIKLRSIGIGMITIYPKDYPRNRRLRILVPAEFPKAQQELS